MSSVIVIGLVGLLAAPEGQIALVRDPGTSTSQVWVVGLAAGAETAVGPGQQDGAPRWSPDGDWLAFETGGGAARSIYVVRPDGRDGRVLQHAQEWNIDPRWSTDGRRLVYAASSTPGGLTQVVVCDLETGAEATWAGGGAGLLRPIWVPVSDLWLALDPETPLEVPGVNMARLVKEARMDQVSIFMGTLPEALLAVQVVPGTGRHGGVGTHAVLTTESEVFAFLHVVLPDVPFNAGAVWEVEPNWEDRAYDFDSRTDRDFGPYTFSDKGDMSRIALTSDEGGDREIYVLSKKGRTNVTNHRAADWNPVWAPDGRRLAFESFRDGRRGIYHVFTDTARVTRLVKTDSAAWSPTWSSDGDYLAFVSDATGSPELYVAAEKGGVPEKVLDGAVASPAWRPEYRQ